MHGNLTIRTRIILAHMLIMAIVSVSIYAYCLWDERRAAIGLICVIMFCVGVMMFSFMTSRITMGIRELQQALSTVSKGQKAGVVNVRSENDIGRLAAAFNEMFYQLERSNDEISLSSNKLKMQNEELKRFSYAVSHDLKAPLRAIFRLSEWIEEDLAGRMDDGTRKNMQTLRARIFRLEALIDGLLQYSKVGRVHVSVEPVDVHSMLKEIIGSLNPPPHITIAIVGEMPVFNTKRMLLRQVFVQLISNAIKFNESTQGIVEIGVSDAGNSFEFYVRDNGVGIDPAQHQRIFEIFQTLNPRDKVEGTGVGLAIVKKSVEHMQGHISLESEPAKGSRFVFTWPKAAIAEK